MNILVDMLDLEQSRMGCPVRGHQPIAQEVLIAGRIRWTVVTAEGPEGLFTRLRGPVDARRFQSDGRAQGLVHPVPDEASLEVWF